MSECRGFQWIGQPFSSCDNCGKPAWEHEGMDKPNINDLGGPFGIGSTVIPWKPSESDAIRRKWGPAPDTGAEP